MSKTKQRSKLATITRRTFLVSSIAITGGVAFGYWKYQQPHENPLEKNLSKNEATLSPYILINQDGITIIAPRAEMGQGVYTTLAAMVAEELDVSLEQVNIIHGPASNAYFNAAVLEEGIPFAQTDVSRMAENMRSLTKIPAKFLGLQITGGSSSVPDAFNKMRLAGAAARQTLMQAAAQQWNVDLSTLTTKDANVVATDGRKIRYQDIAVAAAQIEPPKKPSLKPQSQWRILGKSQPRVDMVAKSTGTAEFGIDIDLPDMLYATVKTNPQLGAGLESFDATAARKLKGVIDIITIENGIAVIASNTWYAMRAVNAIKFNWKSARYAKNTDEITRQVASAFNKDQQNSQFKDNGDVDAFLKNTSKPDIIQGEYFAPYLAHATMEPMNATAWFRDGMLDIWAGNQMPTQAVKEAAQITGLAPDDITLHTTLMGGGFGRRLEMDFIKQATYIAKALPGKPIKLTWSREEDMTHDFYRPMAMARFKAIMGDKTPVLVDYQTSASSVTASQMGRIGIPVGGPDISIVQAAWDQPYDIEHYRVTGYKAQEALPVSSWRSVGSSQNAFFHESIMDELAHAKNIDPMQMRLDLVSHDASHKVLDDVKKRSGWGGILPEGHFQGLAFSLSFGVPAAEVVEIKILDGKVKIIKVFATVDVGIALDPRNIEAQVMGGINFGLAAAIMGEITVKDGQVEQTNFHNYNSIRMNQSPNIDVNVLENGDKIRGIGEPGTPPAAPALANAIFAATGKRIRALPLNKSIPFV